MGQNPNTIYSDSTQINFEETQSPHKATMYSALIPGLGQVYNKKYWKLPIIYGAAGILIYAYDFNNDQYNKYATAYARLISGEIEEFEGVSDPNVVLRAKDEARRNRDLNVITLAAIYFLNIIDATVDAHLFDYEINDDLSLNIQPVVKPTLNSKNSVGLSLSLTF